VPVSTYGKPTMTRAANDVMQSILFSVVLDAIAALKAGSGGLPNNLLRDVQAIHPNVTFADLPKALQDAITTSTRTAFTQLLKEGYAVGPKAEMRPTQRPIDRVPERERRTPADRRTVRSGPGRRGPDGPGPGGGPRGPGGPQRPPRKPKGKPRLG
jgi:hypothetical protein